MQAEEAVLIRCFDSSLEGPARFSAHGRFEDPQTPGKCAAAREIEVAHAGVLPPGM